MERPGLFTRALAIGALATALLTLFLAIKVTVLGYSPLPFWDQWEFVGNEQVWAKLLLPHNEHRIVIPSIFFFVDNALFGGRNLFLITATVAVQLAHVWWFGRDLRNAGQAGSALIFQVALVAVLLLSPLQYENFYWGFQIQFVLVYFLAHVALSSAVENGPGWPGLLVPLGAGFAAAFTLSSGLAVLPIAAVLAAMAGQSRVRVGALTGGAAVAFTLFFWGYSSPLGHSNPLDSISHPIDVIYYALVYLGGPIGNALSHSVLAEVWPPLADPVEAAKLAGALSIVAAGYLTWTLLRLGRQRSQLVLFGLVAFIGAAALMTALGRWELGAQQALASRYSTPVLIYWASLLVWGFLATGAFASETTSRLPASTSVAAGFVAAGVLVMLLLPLHARSAVEVARGHGNQLRATETAVVMQVADLAQLERLHPSPVHVLRQAAEMEARNLSVFGSNWTRWRGRNVFQEGELDPEGCRGVFDTLIPISSETRANGARPIVTTGWAWNQRARRPAERIVLATPNGDVVGLGQAVVDRPDVLAAIPDVTEIRSGWVAHGWAIGGTPLTAYVLLNEGGYCSLESTHSVD